MVKPVAPASQQTPGVFGIDEVQERDKGVRIPVGNCAAIACTIRRRLSSNGVPSIQGDPTPGAIAPTPNTPSIPAETRSAQHRPILADASRSPSSRSGLP